MDENGKVWYPDAGALKASVLMTGQNNGQKEITDEEWTYMKSWLRPGHAEYSKEQTDSAGRGDFQELTAGVSILCPANL